MPRALRIMAGSGTAAVAILWFAASTPASTPSADWSARVWRTDEGLPGNTVSGITQTPDGYLWVGTDGGLARFDGARFQVFSAANLQGVPNRVIRVVFLDSRNRLWLGMDRGPVVCAELSAAHVFTLDDGLPDRVANVMVEGKEGEVWVAYSRGDLVRIKDWAVSRFGTESGLPAGGRLCLTADSQGQIWFARGRTVGVFRDGAFQTTLTLPQPALRLAAARDGGLWICCSSRLFKYHEGQKPKTELALPQTSELFDPTVVFEDHTGAVWLGTATHGLFRYRNKQFEQVSTSLKIISCMAEDREGNIWVGTSGGGLDQLRPRAFELLGSEAGLPFESVRSVCQDEEDTLWLATQNGMLLRQQGNEWETVSAGSMWPGGHVTSVTKAAGGGIWIGTSDHGLYRFRDGQFNVFDRAADLGGGGVRSMLTSSNGDLWIAMDSASRLLQLHEGVFRTFDMPKVRLIRAMAEDAQGNIWLGTSQGQLLRVANTNVTDETSNTSPRLLSIRCLHGTPDGSLWIGYAGWGLGRLKAGHFSQLTASDGLYDDYISQIISDDRGWVWLGGNHGLFRVRLDDLLAVAEGRGPRVRSIVYGRGEGLAGLQVSYDNSPGAARGSDGRLYIATRTGLLEVRTENIRDNPKPPQVLLERVAVDGKTVALYKSYALPREQDPKIADLSSTGKPKLHLEPGHRKIEFQFTAPSLTAPENVHFRYRLDGFDEDWIESPTVRQASYPRLGAGTYHFRVIACNDSGVWNEAGTELEFEVLPFLWQTWWFRLAALGFFTAMVIALARYVSFRRLRAKLRALEQQAALDKERARIAKDIHDDLGGSLTQVTMLLELALRDRTAPDKFTGHVRRSLSAARQMIKSLDETVWAINPRNDTLPHVVNYIAKFAVRFLEAAAIRCRLDLPDHPPELNMPADVRHNLFLVVKEALNNTVRHGQASEVWLRITITEEALRIVIEDNGRGFERAPDDADADGLRNMKQRMGDMGGQFAIESVPGSGTRVCFELPWPRQEPPASHVRVIAPDSTPALK